MTRQQRRRAERVAAKKPRYDKTEVFTFTGDDGQEEWLAVEPLRKWAESALELVSVDIELSKVEDILKSGRVDQAHIRNFTFKNDPKPILVCEDYHEGLSEIVDGNHTYVAMAAASAMAERSGMQLSMPLRAPAYVIPRSEWTRFLVPLEDRITK
ncbi:hypothetical protein [Nioella ostreopsis]|uniref:hypothetical protein n=1 Tax=Nioella ostreopsis TaxID=2448479 RepID=UPI000FD78868|nr:hypothetical protein [Nioella ostreopsis]